MVVNHKVLKVTIIAWPWAWRLSLDTARIMKSLALNFHLSAMAFISEITYGLQVPVKEQQWNRQVWKV